MIMTWRKATKTLIPVLVALAIVYDIIAYWCGGVGATISRATLAWARNWPIIPLSVGVLCGHLFWPQPKEPEK